VPVSGFAISRSRPRRCTDDRRRAFQHSRTQPLDLFRDLVAKYGKLHGLRVAWANRYVAIELVEQRPNERGLTAKLRQDLRELDLARLNECDGHGHLIPGD
jgi:hypothetical protein